MNIFKPRRGSSRRIREVERSRESIENRGREEYFKLRGFWSTTLCCCLVGMLAMQAAISITIVWLNRNNLLEYRWFFALVTGENFFQIIGLCFVVVKYLFKDAPTDPTTSTSEAPTDPSQKAAGRRAGDEVESGQ